MLARMGQSLERLYAAVVSAQHADPDDSRTARLLRAGHGKMAKKLGEEAIEVVLEALRGNGDALVRESADLLYNLVVLWVALGVRPKDVWQEMDRRERLFGIAEKLLKPKAETKSDAKSRWPTHYRSASVAARRQTVRPHQSQRPRPGPALRHPR
jgi:phosphoribosyl-ATP pyrophosphohydrolase